MENSNYICTYLLYVSICTYIEFRTQTGKWTLRKHYLSLEQFVQSRKISFLIFSILLIHFFGRSGAVFEKKFYRNWWKIFQRIYVTKDSGLGVKSNTDPKNPLRCKIRNKWIDYIFSVTNCNFTYCIYI